MELIYFDLTDYPTAYQIYQTFVHEPIDQLLYRRIEDRKIRIERQIASNRGKATPDEMMALIIIDKLCQLCYDHNVVKRDHTMKGEFNL